MAQNAGSGSAPGYRWRHGICLSWNTRCRCAYSLRSLLVSEAGSRRSADRCSVILFRRKKMRSSLASTTWLAKRQPCLVDHDGHHRSSHRESAPGYSFSRATLFCRDVLLQTGNGRQIGILASPLTALRAFNTTCAGDRSSDRLYQDPLRRSISSGVRSPSRHAPADSVTSSRSQSVCLSP